MSEKVKSFDKFLNESSRMDLPSPEEVRRIPEYKEIERILDDRMEVYGGGKQPLEIESSARYSIKFSRTGSIYYGGYAVGTFEEVDDSSLGFVKDYLISKILNISVTSLDSIIEGRTPISNKIIKNDWEKYKPRNFKIFKKGLLDRVKDFSNTIKYYQNHPLDKSYELIPELKKIVEDGFEKSPRKEIKEGELTLEQKNYLKKTINRIGRTQRGYNPELKGNPMYKLDKETGLVDVYGGFDGRHFSVVGNENFTGIKFGRVYGDFQVYSEISLPEKNLSGFPYQVDGYFELRDNEFISSLEGLPTSVGKTAIRINSTSVTDFSLLNKLLEDKSTIDLSGNSGLKSLTQIKFPDKLELLKISFTPIKSLEGCPPEVKELYASSTEIENLKGTLKKAESIFFSSPNLKDLSQIFQIEGLKYFSFRTDENYSSVSMNSLPNEEGIQRIIYILKDTKYYSPRDKELLIQIPQIENIVYDYFEKNPIEFYLLDEVPKIKKDIMQKRGVQDFGKLGKILNKGFI